MAQTAAWLEIQPDHQFGLAALPYCSFTTAAHAAAAHTTAHHAEERRVGVAIGDHVLDLSTAAERLLPHRAHLFQSGRLDDFLAAGDLAWAHVRESLTAWLSQDQFRPAIEEDRKSTRLNSSHVEISYAVF